MTTTQELRRIKIKYRVRKRVSGTAERPRLTVFRSNKQIYAQIINDDTARTSKVGELVAQKAIAAGISEVVFDRNGYLYHGRVKNVADGARNGGLKF